MRKVIDTLLAAASADQAAGAQSSIMRDKR